MTEAEERETAENRDGDETEGSEASLEDLLSRTKSEPDDDDSEEESMLTVERDERVGTLPAKVTPQQATEFVCKKCFLVKHHSQLADERRTLCRDCA